MSSKKGKGKLSDGELGRLKKTTREICPDCESKKLELRVRPETRIEHGEQLEDLHEYLWCPSCETEFPYKKEKRKVHLEWNNKENGWMQI